jgi:hypothetical protein
MLAVPLLLDYNHQVGGQRTSMANKSRGVCQIDGHSLSSVKIAEAVEPSFQLIVSQFEIICTKCGMDLKEVRDSLPTVVKGRETPNDSQE